MRFGLLGPLEVTDGDTLIGVPGVKQRTLLAALLLEPSRVVSADLLIDAIWGDEPLANPANALQGKVSQLRRILAPTRGRDSPRLVVSRPPGYLLDIEPEQVDTVRFERAVAAGRAALGAGDPDQASRTLRQALGLWRGPALAEFADAPFAVQSAARLEALHATATEERIEADLALGGHAEVIGELESLVAAYPLRERLRGQLMLALYRCGRQADALAVFHDTRAYLADELGIDPSPALRERYEAILRQDGTIEAPSPVGAPGGPTRTVPRAARRAGPDPALRDASGAARMLGTRPPASLTTFVGRDDDLARVGASLVRARLVTLTGPGGVGKTRLAAEAARRADAGDGFDEVWWAELGDVASAGELPASVAAAVGLRDEGGGWDAVQRLTDALDDKRTLLVLDNCEHIIDEVAALAQRLLASEPGLAVLCTSREALGIAGETVWSLPSLGVPGDQASTPAEMGSFASVRLFVDRAAAAAPGFELSAANAAAVGEVCRRLDGVPLALELAAARVRAMDVADLARRLDRRFELLSAGSRAPHSRQRTLRAVVEWSWDLLDDAELAVARRLAVFAGGWTLDAAAAVCADGAEGDEVVDIVLRLVDKSLVGVDRGSGSVRYRYLETLRAYALERLVEAGEEAEFRRRHARTMAAFADDTAPLVRSQAQLDAVRLLEAEHENLRAALTWCDEENPALGARIAACLGWYWQVGRHRAEGRRWLGTFGPRADGVEGAIARIWVAYLALDEIAPGDVAPRIRADAALVEADGTDADRALAAVMLALIAQLLGDDDEGHLTTAREAAAAAGDRAIAATADFVEARGVFARNGWARARPYLDAAFEGFTAAGERWGQVQCLNGLYGLAEASGDLERAGELAEHGARLAEELGLGELRAVMHMRRGALAMLRGDPDEATRLLDEARRMSTEVGATLVTSMVDTLLGMTARRRGDLDEAARCHTRALERYVAIGEPSGQALSLAGLGLVAEQRGDLDEAASLHDRGLRFAADTGDVRAIAYALEGLAALAAARGRAGGPDQARPQSEQAARLLGAAAALRQSVGMPLPEPERLDVDRVEAWLSEAADADEIAAHRATASADPHAVVRSLLG